MDAALPLQSLPGSLSVLSCSGWVNLLYPESAGDSSIWVTIKGHKLPPPGFRFRDAVISNDSWSLRCLTHYLHQNAIFWHNRQSLLNQRFLVRSLTLSSDAVSEFVTVARVGEIPEGQGQAFTVGNRMIAVFNDSGTYFAIDDFCPHMGASLAGGYMEDGAVACPWHAWRFSIRDGSWLDNPKIRVDSFEVRVVGDEIQVKPQKRDTTT